MSFGVSGSPRGTSFDYQEAFRAADAALYEAKGEGRNRVRAHWPTPLPDEDSGEAAVAVAGSVG